MDADTLPPRSRAPLLALLLALGAWALAWAGLGGWIRPLAVDAGKLPPLPTPATPLPERLGPLDQYAGIAAHPPFAPDRQPQPFQLPGSGGGQASIFFDHHLTSVLIAPSLRLAILQPAGRPEAAVRVREGEAVPFAPGWRLRELEPRRAVFEGPEGVRELPLRVFDGQGGDAGHAGSGVTSIDAAPEAAPAATAGTRSPPMASLGEDGRSGARPAAPATAGGNGNQAGSTGGARNPPTQADDARARATRERIQERRRQLRQQDNGNTTPPS